MAPMTLPGKSAMHSIFALKLKDPGTNMEISGQYAW